MIMGSVCLRSERAAPSSLNSISSSTTWMENNTYTLIHDMKRDFKHDLPGCLHWEISCVESRQQQSKCWVPFKYNKQNKIIGNQEKVNKKIDGNIKPNEYSRNSHKQNDSCHEIKQTDSLKRHQQE